MALIDAIFQYNCRRLKQKTLKLGRIHRTAETTEVELTITCKHYGDESYFSINVGADNLELLEDFMNNLFDLLGPPDSPVFIVESKPKRVGQTPQPKGSLGRRHQSSVPFPFSSTF
jgi:hypothetical protein